MVVQIDGLIMATNFIECKYSEAIVAFDRVINKNNDLLVSANYGKALALRSNKDYTNALSAIDRAIELVPANRQKDYRYLWKYQGILLVLVGKYERAVQSFDTALKLDPTDLNLQEMRLVCLSMFQKEK